MVAGSMPGMELFDLAPDPDLAWQVDGVCADVSIDQLLLFTSPSDAEEAGRAIEMCGRCPVRQDCGLYALEHDVTGVWAGNWLREPRGARVVRRYGA